MVTSSQPGVNNRRGSNMRTLWKPDGTRGTGESNLFLGASMICGNPLHVEQEVRLLEEGGIDLLHFDIMDGNLVPRIGLAPEFVKAVRQVTELPFDVHLMLANPEPYIPIFADAGADIIVVHAEATMHLPRLLGLIRQHGARPGVALNPATPPEAIRYVLDDIDVILLMMINPGCVGGQFIPAAGRKIADVHNLLGEQANRIHILIDGSVSLKTAPDMLRSGATILTCGSSSIYDQERKSPAFTGGPDLRDSLRAFRRELAEKVGMSA